MDNTHKFQASRITALQRNISVMERVQEGLEKMLNINISKFNYYCYYIFILLESQIPIFVSYIIIKIFYNI